MSKISKRLRDIDNTNKEISLDHALLKVMGGSGVKFDETVDVAVRLGIDSRKSDQVVRGSVVLPAGTGKKVRVAVVAATEGDRQVAQEEGADEVGFENLIAKIGEGHLDFDVLIASPDAMRNLSAVAKVLGPRGLMPNPKNGTVSKDIKLAVTNAKAGQIRFRSDKFGIIHAPVGKASFQQVALKENIESLLKALKKIKPSSSKGLYFRQLSLSCTMGRSVRVDISSYR